MHLPAPARRLGSWLDQQWLAIALVVLSLPNGGSLAGAICGLGLVRLSLLQPLPRRLQLFLIALIAVLFSRLWGIERAEPMGIETMLLGLVALVIGAGSGPRIAALLQRLAWCPAAIVVSASLLPLWRGDGLSSVWFTRRLGELTINQSATLAGILLSITLLQSCLACRVGAAGRITAAWLWFLPAAALSLAIGQRLAYVIPVVCLLVLELIRQLTNSQTNRRQGWLLPLGVLLALAITATQVPQFLGKNFGITTSEPIRINALQCVTAATFDSPVALLFGHGFSSVGERCAELLREPGWIPYHPTSYSGELSAFSQSHAHNILAQITFNLGLPLGLAFGAVLAIGLRQLWMTARQQPLTNSESGLSLAMALLYCTMSAMVQASFLKLPALTVLFFLIWGASLNRSQNPA